jgi:hypothetical protein
MSTRDDSSDPLIPNINEGSFSLERVGEQQFDDDYYSAPKKSKSSVRFDRDSWRYLTTLANA